MSTYNIKMMDSFLVLWKVGLTLNNEKEVQNKYLKGLLMDFV